MFCTINVLIKFISCANNNFIIIMKIKIIRIPHDTNIRILYVPGIFFHNTGNRNSLLKRKYKE